MLHSLTQTIKYSLVVGRNVGDAKGIFSFGHGDGHAQIDSGFRVAVVP